MTSSPGHSRCAVLGKFALSWIEPVVCRISLLTRRELALVELDLAVLAVGENRERRLGLSAAAAGSRGRSVSGSVKITEIGSSCVTTTRPLASVGWMTLPTSIWRMPMTPSIGDVSRV